MVSASIPVWTQHTRMCPSVHRQFGRLGRFVHSGDPGNRLGLCKADLIVAAARCTHNNGLACGFGGGCVECTRTCVAVTIGTTLGTTLCTCHHGSMPSCRQQHGEASTSLHVSGCIRACAPERVRIRLWVKPHGFAGLGKRIDTQFGAHLLTCDRCAFCLGHVIPQDGLQNLTVTQLVTLVVSLCAGIEHSVAGRGSHRPEQRKQWYVHQNWMLRPLATVERHVQTFEGQELSHASDLGPFQVERILRGVCATPGTPVVGGLSLSVNFTTTGGRGSSSHRMDASKSSWVSVSPAGFYRPHHCHSHAATRAWTKTNGSVPPV